MLSFLMPAGTPRRQASDGWWSGTWYGTRRQTLAGANVDEDLALTYAAVWACCRVYCEGLGSVPLVTYEREDGDNRKPATDHRLYDVLKYQPNPYMTAMALRESRTLHQLNWGQGFCEIVQDYQDGLMLWPIHPGRVKPSRPGDQLEGGQPVPVGSYLVRNNDGSYTAMPPEQILHIPGRFPEDGIWGKGCVSYARETIGMGLATERHGAVSFGHGNVPRVAISGIGLKNDEARKRFRAEWKQVHGSPDSGDVAILPVDAKFEKLSFSNEDNQFLGTRAYNGQEICRWYGVPPHMVAYLEEGGAAATLEQLGLEFVLFSLYPMARRWEEQCCFKLLTPAERQRYFVEHDFKEVVIRCAPLQDRMTSYRIGIGSGVLSINECRRFEGLNTIGPDGDKHYVPLNLATVEDMANGTANAGRGIGSDQSGGFAENGAGEGNTDGDRGMASFDAWTRRRLGTIERGEVLRRLDAIDASLRSQHRAAMTPVPGNLALTQVVTTDAAPVSDADANEDAVREGCALIEVPDIRQPDEYSCGASAAMAVGKYFGVGPDTIDGWKDALGTTLEYSTRPRRIVDYLSQLGLVVTAAHNMTIEDLRRHWRHGRPVICCVQDYGDRRDEGAKFLYGHYLTVIGVDVGYVFCQDSSLENAAHVPGGDVPPAKADNAGNIAAPGRLMVDFNTWNAVWHDEDADGVKYIHFGIAVGRQRHPGADGDADDDDGMGPVGGAMPERLPVGKATATQPQSAPTPDHAPALDAAKAALADVLARMFRKEAKAAARAAKGDFDAWVKAFYPKHERLMVDALMPACAMLGAAGTPTSAMHHARRLCDESSNLLLHHYNTVSPTQWTALLAAWAEPERVQAEVDRFL